MLFIPRGLIPAYAGSTRLTRFCSWSVRAHPRLRGEHLAPHLRNRLVAGSSPLTRGAQKSTNDCSRPLGLIPAYAGSTNSRPAPTRSHWAHPRLRGEHAVAANIQPATLGSSPLTRGALRQWRLRHPESGLIPAYAGSTLRGDGRIRRRRAHPRLRGEHALNLLHVVGPLGSSPLTRGARPKRISRFTADRLIPAYAGSTSRAISVSRATRAHPRLRGEHMLLAFHGEIARGSSPLTRGALLGR